MYSWDRFKNVVLYNSRYFFTQETDNFHDSSEEIPPHQFLNQFALYVGPESLNLIKDLPRDTDIFRVRVHDNSKEYTKASELGAPPTKLATRPNRMSPAGISMFYGAFDINTAILETYESKDETQTITIGKFANIKNLKLLDLAHLPSIPSVFDVDHRGLTHPLRFLYEFRQSISEIVERDDRVHIDYVPTQVVTEYFRRVYKLPNDEKIDGIIYKSSRDGGKEACVLFIDNSGACDSVSDLDLDKHILILKSTKTISSNSIEDNT